MDESDGSADSVHRDYSPYIDAPPSTNPDAISKISFLDEFTDLRFQKIAAEHTQEAKDD